MDIDDLLEPYTGSLTVTRNETKLSKLSNAIVISFLRSQRECAKVRYELTEFSQDTLCMGLRTVCSKPDFKNIVKVSKRGEHIILRLIRH